MKEDYLWDKTGSDPEIEKLENSLKAFRQKDETPPAFPAKIIPVEIESPRRSFPFAFAFAASVTFVLILVGVWSQLGTGNSQIISDLAQNTRDNVVVIPIERSIEEPVQTSSDREKRSPIKVSESTITTRKRKISNTKNVNAKEIRHAKKIHQKTKVKQINSPESVKLTKEEQYAYDQLMLALSITSEKLNLVKDKVNGEVKEEISIKKKIENRSN